VITFALISNDAFDAVEDRAWYGREYNGCN